MIRACRYALAGQLGALAALLAVEILPFGSEIAGIALRLACGFEAVGYGAAGLVAVAGWGLGRPMPERVVRAGLSLVLLGLGVRHTLLVADPMGGDPALSAPSTWTVALVMWAALLRAGAKRGVVEEASWAVRGGWLAGIAAVGLVNTLAMATVRTMV